MDRDEMLYYNIHTGDGPILVEQTRLAEQTRFGAPQPHVAPASSAPSSRSRPRPSVGRGRALAAAALRRRAARRRRGADRAVVGRGVLGDRVSTPMTAQLRFQNLTLGYDRHPAVHHLDGSVPRGALM